MLVRALRSWGALLLILSLACPATTADAATPKTKRTKAAGASAASSRAGQATAKSAAGAKVARKSKTPAKVMRKRSRRRPSTVASRRKTRRRHAPAPPPGGVYARNAVVIDLATDKVLFEKKAEQTVPIASITKLMTALVFLEQQPDLRRSVEVTRDEIRGGGHTQLWNRERVALYDLLHMSLMNSDNVATRVLARESGLDRAGFVLRMNEKARELDLANTRFAETTGLDNRNVSTAVDVARLLRAAADHYLIREVTTTPDYVFLGEYPGRRRTITRTHQIVNTNRLLRSNRYEFSCSKTGFISQSGYCVATWVRDRGRDLIAVVLGAPTNATRFADVVRLVQRTQTEP
jgi:D-alanyl-D-alanine endopeptidase (penicillin-binding protein 7)